jgi:hypothetical protein
MNAEEQLRELRDPLRREHRKVVKHKIMSLVMLGLAALCAVYAYEQRLEAEAQRNEVVRLYRDMKKLREESEAARVEASKLRSILEFERKKTEEALQMNAKKK